MMGSDIPAFSLFATTSLNVEPTATILLSSSDKAIQLFRGAERSASRRASSGAFMLIRRLRVSEGFRQVNVTSGPTQAATFTVNKLTSSQMSRGVLWTQ